MRRLFHTPRHLIPAAVVCLASIPCAGVAQSPSQPVELLVQIVDADVAAPSGDLQGPELPPRARERLRDLLRYRSFRRVGRAQLSARRAEETSHPVGDDYRVVFRLEPTADEGRLAVRSFRLVRATGADGPRTLVETDLELTPGRPLILGLSANELSRRALMVILETPEVAEGRS